MTTTTTTTTTTMTRSRYGFSLSVLALMIAAPVPAAHAKTDKGQVVAVLYFDNNTGDPSFDVLQKGFADMMITDLSGVDGVTVVERDKLQALLDEIALQKNKYFDNKTAIKLGKGLGASYALTGAFYAMKPSLRLDVRLIEIATGKVVLATKVSGRHDAIFELEQELVARFVAAMKKKFAPSQRAWTRVPDVDVLLEYAKAVDLADQGRYEDATQALAQVVQKAPGFALARVRRDDYLARLEAARKRREGEIKDRNLSLIKKAEDYVSGHELAKLSQPDAKLYIVYRVLRGRFMLRALGQHLSSGKSMRVVKRGHETRAERLMKAYYQNTRLLIDELAFYARTFTTTYPNGVVHLDTWFRLPKDEEQEAREAGLETSFGPETNAPRRALGEFLLLGKAHDGTSRITVAPPLAESSRELAKIGYTLLHEAWAEADAEAKDRPHRLNEAITTLDTHAESLSMRDKHDEAIAKWQEILDRYPTSSSFSRYEATIQAQLGVKHDHTVRTLERYAKGLKECKDMDLRVGLGTAFYRRMRRAGLRGLDQVVAEVETHCQGNRDARNFWPYLYKSAALGGAEHGDCEMFDSYMQRYLDAGGSQSDARGYRKNYSTCPAPGSR
jgi:TolB-like protein